MRNQLPRRAESSPREVLASWSPEARDLGKPSREGAKSEAEEAHFRADAEFCGSDEEEPLGEVVAHEHEVVAVWHWLDEFVPGEDEVGEHEEDGSEGEEAAALEHGGDHHDADQGRVDAYADADDAGGSLWGYLEEGCAEKGQGAEHDHGEVSLGLSGELAVRLYTTEVPACEIYDIEYMAESEEAHLAEEVVA